MKRSQWLALALMAAALLILTAAGAYTIGATAHQPTPVVVERILPYQVEVVREVTRVVEVTRIERVIDVIIVTVPTATQAPTWTATPSPVQVQATPTPHAEVWLWTPHATTRARITYPNAAPVRCPGGG